LIVKIRHIDEEHALPPGFVKYPNTEKMGCIIASLKCSPKNALKRRHYSAFVGFLYKLPYFIAM